MHGQRRRSRRCIVATWRDLAPWRLDLWKTDPSPYVLAALLALGAATTAASQAPATGLVLGQVIDATTGRGVAGAIVTLAAAGPPRQPIGELLNPPAPAAAPANARRSLTAGDGRFLFRDLPKGRYEITAAAPGYIAGAHGQMRPSGPSQPVDLDDHQKTGGAIVRVWKTAAISGMVIDERGEPAVGVSVRWFRRVISGGQPRFASGIGATSDDRGIYRIADLAPGDYVVGLLQNPQTVPATVIDTYLDASQAGTLTNSAVNRALSTSGGIMPTTSGMRVGDLLIARSGSPAIPAPSEGGRLMTYATQFHPNAIAPSRASLVTLRPGEDRTGIDLHLRLVPAVRVSGRVTGPAGPGAYLGMTLVPPTGSELQSESMAEAASAITDASGAFTFLGVTPGQYLLKVRMFPRPVGPTPGPIVTVEGVPVAGPGRGAPPPPPPPAEPTLWAVVPLTVGDTDLTDIGVTLRTGLKVTGRVEFAGTRPAPSTNQILRMTIRHNAAEGRTSAPIAAEGRAAADLTFLTAGIPAGRYILQVLASTIPAGWSLKSITSGQRDISVEPFELSDADLTGVVITFTDKVTELSGSVTGANGPDPSAEVIVFPADSIAWRDIGVPARRGRNERVTKAGTFAITGLPPGEYFVVAVPTTAVADGRDPRWLQTLVGAATRVTLGDGEKRSIALRIKQ